MEIFEVRKLKHDAGADANIWGCTHFRSQQLRLDARIMATLHVLWTKNLGSEDGSGGFRGEVGGTALKHEVLIGRQNITCSLLCIS